MLGKLLLVLAAGALLAACQRADRGALPARPGPSQEDPAAAEAAADPELGAALEGLGFQLPTAAVPSVDFTLEDLAGGRRSLESFRGKVVFLNFWATWCPPCRAEMPSMESLYRELRDEGLEIVAVNSQEARQEVARFIEAGDHTFPVLLDSGGQVGTAYAVRAIPTTYLVSRDGRILGRMTGSRDWYTPDTLEALRKVLQQ